MSDLIDRIIDEGAIKKQLDALDIQLEKSSKNLAATAVQAKIFSDAFGNSKGITDIIKLTENYNQLIITSQKVQNEMVNQQKQRVDIDLKLQKVQESNARIEVLNAQAAAATAKAQEIATKAEQARTQSSEKQVAQASKAVASEKVLQDAENALIGTLKQAGINVDKLNVSKSQATSVNKLVTTINNSEKGSLAQLSAQYDLNYKAYYKLSEEQRNSTAGKAMADSLGSQSKNLKEMEGKLGNFTRTVGDYKNQILGAVGANQGFLGNLANMAMGAEKTGGSFATAGVSGIKAFGTAMWELMANPIVATIAAIAAVVMLVKAAIDSNGEATNKLKQVMAPFNEILVFVLNSFSELVSWLLSGVIALEKFANVVMLIIPGLDKIAAKNLEAMEIEKQKQVLSGKSRQLMVDEARTHEQTTEAMNKSRQKDKYSVEQRLAWLKSADDEEITLNEQKVEHAKQTFSLLKKEMENEGKSYAELTSDKKDAYKKAEADIYAAREEYFAKTRRLQSQESNLLLESQKDYIDGMTKKGTSEIEQWKTSQNASNMNSKQKIAYEQEYANKVIDLQQKTNKQRITDQIGNDAIGLEKLKSSIDKKIRMQNDAWINEATTKEEHDRRFALTFKVIASQQAEEEKKIKESTNKKVSLINDENSVLESQRAQDNQKAIAEYESYQIQLTQKQNESGLLKLKADHDTNTMNFEDKMRFDSEYFVQEEAGKKKVLDLQKKYNKITSEEYKICIENLKSDQKIFVAQQASSWVQHYEQTLGEQKSFSESQVRLTQDYGDKSIGYQQHLTRLLFEIQADLDTQLAEQKLKSGKIDQIAFQTQLDNIKAQRAAMIEAQKGVSEADELSRSLAIAKQKSDTEIQIVADKYAKGKINASKYEKELKEISEKGAIERLDVEIWEIENNLKIEKLSNSEKIKLQQELDDKKAQKAQKVNNETIKKEKAVQKAIVDLIKTSAAAIKEIGDNQFQEQLDKIDALKTANTEAAANETDLIDKKYKSGVISQEEADARKASIDDQAKAREAQLNEESKQTKIKQAKFDKEMSVFNILLNTATAVTEALPNIPLSVIIGAMGAMELAAVISKPLPAYALGTEDHPGGPALVGEVRPEMIRTPDNKIIKVDKPTIMSLPVHTKVFPDYDKALQEMAFDASIRSMYATTPSIEINAYNDALMRKQMGSLVKQTERQIGELGRLKDIGKYMENMVSTNQNIDKTLKGMKKNPWVK